MNNELKYLSEYQTTYDIERRELLITLKKVYTDRSEILAAQKETLNTTEKELMSWWNKHYPKVKKELIK